MRWPTAAYPSTWKCLILDKREQYGQKKAARHSVVSTPRIGSAFTSVSRRLTSLLGCQKDRAQLQYQKPRGSTHSHLESHIRAPE